MKISEMTAEQIRHLALRLNDSGKMPLAKMEPIQALRAGNFWAWVAKTEECKKYWRAAKADLRQRELNGTSYKGDAGHVTIGGRRFTFYPTSGMIVRDDFATWCEAHFGDYFFPTGRLRAEQKPHETKEVGDDSDFALAKEVRKLARDMAGSTQIYPPQAYHTEFQMRHDLMTLVGALEDCRKQGELYPLLKADCDLLAAKIAYRQRKYAEAKERLLNLSAAALKAAMFIQEHHNDAKETK